MTTKVVWQKEKLMGKAISRGQALQIAARVATQVNWDELDGDRLQTEVIDLTTEEFSKRVTAFLRNGARVIIGEPRIAKIDRTKSFNPAEFIGNGWTIEEQDERSLALAEVDIAAIRFETMFNDGETRITGEEKLKRLKSAGYVRLDAKVFQTFWENQYLIPERFKEKTNGNTTFVFFDGSVFRSPYGSRSVLFLFWIDSRWNWRYAWLADDLNANNPSAVLASI